MRLWRVMVLLSSIVTCVAAGAQSGSVLKGQITFAGGPLSQASVSLVPSRQVPGSPPTIITTTNQAGNYQLIVSRPGQYIMLVKFNGTVIYQNQLTMNGSAQTINIPLSRR